MENVGFLTSPSLSGSDKAKYNLAAIRSQDNSVTKVINVPQGVLTGRGSGFKYEPNGSQI